ncbi:MAG TPA: DUF4129 domain-containing protein [Thermoanaerobaculia bacterium]|nr:DUF4129 domain-containing protein [Thermoanaerobaculia bacterium]
MKRFLLLLLLAFPAAAMPVADYIAALERIDALLASNQLDAAKSAASALKDVEIVWAKGKFKADASLLAGIEKGERARLIATITELRRAAGMSAAQADRKLLEQIAAEQEPPELPKGGLVPTKIQRDVPLLERIANAISDMFDWIAEKLGKFFEWILDLVPRRRAPDGTPTPGLHWIVWAVVGAIVLGILYLAVDVLRRSRAAGPAEVETSTPIGSRQDEDPLSRGALEWETYANDLATARRHREAIRAWYHAVLVTCYAAGILHFRKGRTNWEYIASLAPSLAWRPDAIALTRRFEQEWYGALHSTADAYEECSELARSVLDALRREMRGAA